MDGGLGNCEESRGVEILGGGTLHIRLGDILLLGFLRPAPLFSDFTTSGYRSNLGCNDKLFVSEDLLKHDTDEKVLIR